MCSQRRCSRSAAGSSIVSRAAPDGTTLLIATLSTHVLVPATAMAGAYFLCNSGLMALAVSSETGTPAYRVWREHFMWLSLNYFGGASVALLLALNWENLYTLVLVVPLVVISYYTFKTSMEQVEDAAVGGEAARQDDAGRLAMRRPRSHDLVAVREMPLAVPGLAALDLFRGAFLAVAPAFLLRRHRASGLRPSGRNVRLSPSVSRICS